MPLREVGVVKAVKYARMKRAYYALSIPVVVARLMGISEETWFTVSVDLEQKLIVYRMEEEGGAK